MTSEQLAILESCEESARIPPERGGTDYGSSLTPRQHLTLKQLAEKS